MSPTSVAYCTEVARRGNSDSDLNFFHYRRTIDDDRGVNKVASLMRNAHCLWQAFLPAYVTLFVLFSTDVSLAAEPRLIGVGAMREGDGNTFPKPVVVLTPEHRASFEQTLAVLPKVVTGDFFESPLTSVVERLRKESGCIIRIDEKGLADAAIGTDTPINIRLGKASLRTVLDEALRPHALGWTPLHPGILITTQEQLDMNPDYRLTYLYPVADLVMVDDSELGDYDTLIDALTSMVHPESWREGGTGEAVIVPFPMAKALITTQTFANHEQINAFLQSLREAKGLRGDLPVYDSLRADPDRYRVRPASVRRRRNYWSPQAAPSHRESPREAESGGVF